VLRRDNGQAVHGMPAGRLPAESKRVRMPPFLIGLRWLFVGSGHSSKKEANADANRDDENSTGLKCPEKKR
jgi:hypothetical protein